MTVPANLNVLKNHRYADIFPMMNEDDFNRLMEDVRENGLQEPIWLYEGKILDGRNRYKACQELGIAPELRKYQGSDPLKFVMSLNLARRHLNSSQCAFVALEVERVLAEEAKERQALKNKWIEKARREFSPGERTACYVCGGYKDITEAHHTIPLYWQYDSGFIEPYHHAIWLCPNHHKIVHLCGESMMSKKTPFYAGAIVYEWDAINDVVDLWVAADLKDRIKNQEYPDRVVKAFITKVESKWGICV